MNFTLASSGMVYEDAEKLYAKVKKNGKELLEEAFAALSHKSLPLSNDRPTSLPYSGHGGLLAVNTTFLPRVDVVKIPIHKSDISRLKSWIVHLSADKTVGYALMDGSNGFGLAEPRGLLSDCHPPTGKCDIQYFVCILILTLCLVFIAQMMTSDDVVIKNSGVQLTIKDGRITSLYDVQLKYVFKNLSGR